MIPFGFAGVLLVPLSTSAQVLALRDKIAEALRSEGARGIGVGETRIVFSGLTGTRTLRPLVNIQKCEICFEKEAESARVSYICSVEWWPFLGVVLISFGFAILAVSGSPAAYHAGIFALIAFVLFVANSLIVRRRFRRWLASIVTRREAP
ncbi:hypothetical protein ACFQZO_27345 [Bradyrhizobium sp. GCM10027634]|uniref:hypothetical protein n=1 Tax=unclassified Bradyrhizobium TaxID=2631580 RepID=UPI00188D1CCC|nr:MULTISPECIES: hypothetical protein [unclassified Bradyrhizobium]MDN5004567.1 hypothetical protein [Bradyrhizobium sp. WYCCWR 12677]